MEKLIKENIVYLLIIVIAFVAGIYFVVTMGQNVVNNINTLGVKKDDLGVSNQKLEQIRAQKARSKKEETEEKKEAKNSKVIYEVSGEQFSAEASFGIMFENILANMTNSGLKIHSIDYNYSPAGDAILESGNTGYNACELSFTAIGSYSQLQTFFKNLAKENYLTGIYEIYLEPYDKDKSILISKFKIRLYTRTV